MYHVSGLAILFRTLLSGAAMVIPAKNVSPARDTPKPERHTPFSGSNSTSSLAADDKRKRRFMPTQVDFTGRCVHS